MQPWGKSNVMLQVDHSLFEKITFLHFVESRMHCQSPVVGFGPKFPPNTSIKSHILMQISSDRQKIYREAYWRKGDFSYLKNLKIFPRGIYVVVFLLSAAHWSSEDAAILRGGIRQSTGVGKLTVTRWSRGKLTVIQRHYVRPYYGVETDSDPIVWKSTLTFQRVQLSGRNLPQSVPVWQELRMCCFAR